MDKRKLIYGLVMIMLITQATALENKTNITMTEKQVIQLICSYDTEDLKISQESILCLITSICELLGFGGLKLARKRKNTKEKFQMSFYHEEDDLDLEKEIDYYSTNRNDRRKNNSSLKQKAMTLISVIPPLMMLILLMAQNKMIFIKFLFC